MCHSFRSACQQRVLKSVSWPWLYTLRGLGSLTMAFTGKSIYIIYNINIYYVEVYIYIYILYKYTCTCVCVLMWGGECSRPSQFCKQSKS